MNITLQVMVGICLLALLGLGDVLTVELPQLSFQGLLGLSGWDEHLLYQTISDKSVLWFDLHLQVLGVVEEASSNTFTSTELSSEVEQAHLVNWDSPFLRNLVLQVLKIWCSLVWVVNFKALR
jgi:hypothetical protein